MESFALEWEAECEYDYVELYDDNGYTSGKLCGEDVTYDHVSAGNVMYLHFYTDFSITLEGFSLHYEAIAGKSLLCFQHSRIHYPSRILCMPFSLLVR